MLFDIVDLKKNAGLAARQQLAREKPSPPLEERVGRGGQRLIDNQTGNQTTYYRLKNSAAARIENSALVAGSLRLRPPALVAAIHRNVAGAKKIKEKIKRFDFLSNGVLKTLAFLIFNQKFFAALRARTLFP